MASGFNYVPFRVALIGRPNVGKSSLFNFLTRSRNAVVKNEPGVTRDIQVGVADWWGKQFEVLDTGGLTHKDDDFSPLIFEQVLGVLKSVDLIVFMLDAKSGFLPEDREIFRIVKETGKPYILTVNKVDNEQKTDLLTAEFYELGEEIIPIAIESRSRTDQVVEKILARIPDVREVQTQVTRIAIVGKPNVGKSSLVNRILGEKRVIVSDVAGTTVDAIEERFTRRGRDYVIVDTAGLRRRAQRLKRDDGVEIFSSYKSVDAIKRADIVLLVIDAEVGPTEQDAKIASEVFEEHKPLVVVANKADLARHTHDEYRDWFRDKMEFSFHFAADLPIVFTSAVSGQGIDEVFKFIENISQKVAKRIPTSELNKFFYDVVRQAPSPVCGTTNVKFYYLTQTEQVPPSFIAFANHPDGVTPAYRRFLVQRIKDNWELKGVPVRVFIMKSGR
jgi:GTP-binding protein